MHYALYQLLFNLNLEVLSSPVLIFCVQYFFVIYQGAIAGKDI